MKILFLGYAVSPELAGKLSGASVAGNKMQVSVLQELSQYADIDLKAISVYPIASFPGDKCLYVQKEKLQIQTGLISYRAPFFNLPIVKQIWQTLSVYRLVKQHADKETILLTFNLFPQIGLPAMWAKKKLGCKTCALLADLPINDEVGVKNPIKNLLRNCFDRLTLRAITECDRLIVLNKNAAESYAPGTPYIVVEGGVDAQHLAPGISVKDKTEKRIVYGGALTEYSGILTLIEAMKYVEDKDAKLHIYGSGYVQNQVEQMAQQIPNVEYHGRISNQEMLRIQKEAYLLVNPRPVEDSIAKVTFPSKLFEYMISGTPVLTTKLNGINEAFQEHLYLAEDSSAQELARMMNTVLQLPSCEVKAKATGAYSFVVSEKNWKKQCERIYAFLKDI